jgi:phenylacetate-CoA ligase
MRRRLDDDARFEMNRGLGFARDLAWALGRPHRPGAAELEAFQLRRLRAVVRHAWDHVPFYRRRFEAARFAPDQLESLADLERIPVVDKEDLREAGAGALADNVDRGKLIGRFTSGTSGIPFEVLRTRGEVKLLTAIALRRLHLHGIRVRDHRVVVKSPEPGMSGGPEPNPIHARLGFNPRVGVDATQSRDRIVARLRELRPDVISGWAQTLADTASTLTDEDRELIRPRLICPGGETLSVRARALIADGFRAPILDRYGADEIMQMADECRAGGTWHLIESTGLFEVIADASGRRARPGESGEMVVTGFFSWSMPFIRYRIGDRVTAGDRSCPCGADVPTLLRLEGRTMDLFDLPDGRRVHPSVLDLPFLAEVPWLLKYQFVQRSLDRVALRLVPLPGSAPPSDAASSIERRLAAGHSLPLTVRCEIVPDLEHRAGGKFRAYVSMR